MGQIHGVEQGDLPVAPVRHLTVIGFQDLIKTGHVRQASRWGAQPFSRSRAPFPSWALFRAVVAVSVVDRQFQHAGDVHVPAIFPSVALSRNIRFHTSHHLVIARILQFHIAGEHAGNGYVVVEDLRLPGTEADHVRSLHLQFPGSTRMHTYGQPGTGQPGMDMSVQHHESKVVGGIEAFFIHSSNRQRGTSYASVSESLDQHVISQFVQIPDLDEEILDQFLHLFPGGLPRFQIMKIVGIHVPVEAAVGNGMAIAFHMNHAVGQIHQLDGLPERARRFRSDHPQIGCHFSQLVRSLLLRLLLGHGLGQFCVPLDMPDGRFTGNAGGFQEDPALDCIRSGRIQRFRLLPDQPQDAAESK